MWGLEKHLLHKTGGSQWKQYCSIGDTLEICGGVVGCHYDLCVYVGGPGTLDILQYAGVLHNEECPLSLKASQCLDGCLCS
jgi:hypothetical protein